METRRERSLIIDANVLIDYYNTDLSVLGILSQHIGQVYIGKPTLEKVDQLSVTDAEKSHLKVVTPTRDELLSLANQVLGALAFDDRVTLHMAKSNRWTCITNDQALRRECEKNGVAVMWGLEPMKILVRAGLLNANKAKKIARLIQQSNSGYITEDIVARFEGHINRLVGRSE